MGTHSVEVDDRRRSPGWDPPGAIGANSLGGYLAEDLGAGWTVSGDHATLDPAGTTLPRGDYTVRALAFLIDQEGQASNCDTGPCERVHLDNTTVDLKTSADGYDGAASEMHSLSWAFHPVGSGNFVMISIQVDGTGITPAQRYSDVAAIEGWYASMRNSLLKAATDQRIKTALINKQSNVQRLIQLLGGVPWIENYGKALLPEHSKLDNPLPGELYTVTGEIQLVTQARSMRCARSPAVFRATSRTATERCTSGATRTVIPLAASSAASVRCTSSGRTAGSSART